MNSLPRALRAIPLMLLVSSGIAQAADYSFYDGRLTVTLPDGWTVAKKSEDATSASVTILVPYEPAGPESRASAVIAARPVEKGVTVQAVGDRVYQKTYEGFFVAGDLVDGRAWRTMLWSARSKTPFAMLDRFGVAGGFAVETMLAMPLTENSDLAQFTAIVEQFNEVIESLRIDGKNEHRTRFVVAAGSLLIRHDKGKESNRLEIAVRKAEPAK